MKRNYKPAEARAIRAAWTELEAIADRDTALPFMLEAAFRLDRKARGDALTAMVLLIDTIATATPPSLDGLACGHCVALGVRATLERRFPREFKAWRYSTAGVAIVAGADASTRAWEAASTRVDRAAEAVRL